VAAYAAACVLQLLLPVFATAVLARAVNGLAGAALITITIYYLMQVFPAKLRPLALVAGISLTQLGPALARTIPVEFLAAGHWRGLHLTELAVALTVLTALLAVPLPPSDRSKAFEPLDFVTIALIVPAMILFCGVLSAGRTVWWFDTPWLGWALAASIPLFVAALVVEHSRAHPLIQTRWIGTADIIRFAAVALLVRLALAEQTYGSVGLLTLGGLTNDQLRLLFLCVAGAMVIGMVVAVLTLSVERLPYLVMTAALVIAFAAWLDSHATNRGADHFVTVVVLFSTTQNVGGLAGSALLGSYQTIAERMHAASLSEHLTGFDPQVVARIQSGAPSLAGTVLDPLALQAQGAGQLAVAAYQEANILAFNDTFGFVSLLALVTAAYAAYAIFLKTVRKWRTEREGAAR
jgi:MFS family permease